MSLHVLGAVDPGGTTGLARVYHVADVPRSCQLAQVECWDVKGGRKDIDPSGVYRFITDTPPELTTMWVVEDFNSTGQLSRDGKNTIELVGIVIGICVALGLTYEVVQPQARYCELPEAQTREGRVHETDALAHGLARLRRERCKG